MTPERELVTPSGPDAGYLVVVRPDRPDVVTALQARLGNDPTVEVVGDRRKGERRAWWPTVDYPEQRRGVDRRQRSGAWAPLGFVVFRRPGTEPIPAATPEELEALLQQTRQEGRRGT